MSSLLYEGRVRVTLDLSVNCRIVVPEVVVVEVCLLVEVLTRQS